jgi:hypothetical protein
MGKRILLSAVLAAFLVAVGASVCLAWCYNSYEGKGQVTIPNGDPVVGILVKFYRWGDGQYIGCTTTNDYGYWSYCFPYCQAFYTACVGEFRRKGTTECVTEIIGCSGITWFDDIVLECGGPKQPPCPSQ